MAKRQSWKTQPVPVLRVDLGFTQTYGPVDFERITRGLIPQGMDDKWFIYFEEPWLYLHRSWTGVCIYGVRFQPRADGFAAVGSWVNREEYLEDSIEYDRAILSFLIDRELLGRTVPFPVRGDLPTDSPAGALHNHPFGRAYPHSAFPAAPPTLALSERLRAWWSSISGGNGG